MGRAIQTVVVADNDTTFEEDCNKLAEQGYVLVSSSCQALTINKSNHQEICKSFMAIWVLPELIASNAEVMRPVKYLDDGYYEPQGMIRAYQKDKPSEHDGLFLEWCHISDIQDSGVHVYALIEAKNGHVVQRLPTEMRFIPDEQLEPMEDLLHKEKPTANITRIH